MIMRKLLLLICLMTIGLSAVDAQGYKELIKDNPAYAGANMMNYHYDAGVYTPAPKGFKPFYISHYGRHGSRYDTSDVNAEKVWPIMREAHRLGLLTPAGEAFCADLDAVLSEQDGMYGMLTGLGAKEHRQIAERMAANFPEVFSGAKGRRKVECLSSLSPRCIVSMTNFSLSLDRNTKGLDFNFVTGNRIYDIIAYQPQGTAPKKVAATKEEDVRRETMKPMEIIEYFFNDTGAALELTGDPYSFEQRLYLASCVGHLSDHGTCLLAHFPYEVLVRNFEVRNPRFYLSYGMSDEMSDYQIQISRKLLSDIVEKADAALKDDSQTAADLRFGHDTALLPLVGHLRLEGLDNWVAFDKVNEVFNSATQICMASNLQMIFYRNKSGEVLVKLMYNEKETSIPSLNGFSGPYYKWEDLREYFVSLL